MAAQGRKNVHGKAGVRFKAGYTASKNKAMLRNVVTDLILIGEVKVTSGVVRELKQLADHLVTLGKKGDLHARRLAAQILRTNVVRKDGRDALDVLFNDIAKAQANRQGGYTKAFKLGPRRGDCAEVCLVRFVD